MNRSCKVAVIGAGVAGLVAARELLRQHHLVTLFEKSHRIGGTWVYDPSPSAGHSSLYLSLRTNLPRPLMGFHDHPFDRCYGDARAFPWHGEVLSFLEEFGRESGVAEVVRLGTEVVGVVNKGEEWVVEWRREGEEVVVELFQAAVVCNGHHSEPRLPEISGMDRWPGKQIHSRYYRTPEPFQDQIVVVIGNGPSAHDMSREISKVAKAVHLSSRSKEVELGKIEGHDNIWQHSMAILFRMMELQAKWVAQVLSGELSLPSEEDMTASTNQLYLQMEEAGTPKHHTHNLHPNEDKYLNWLAAELGLPPLEEWIYHMYRAALKSIHEHDDGFRDTWDADYWNQQSQISL